MNNVRRNSLSEGWSRTCTIFYVLVPMLTYLLIRSAHVIYRSLFVIHCSLFIIHYSLFQDLYSQSLPGKVMHSRFDGVVVLGGDAQSWQVEGG